MEKSKIEWTDSTYNPVTGCYNNCPYCYARRIANRLKGCDNCPSGICPSLVRIIELSHRLQATSKDGKRGPLLTPSGLLRHSTNTGLTTRRARALGRTYSCARWRTSSALGCRIPGLKECSGPALTLRAIVICS